MKKGSEKPNGNLTLMCRITVDGEIKQFSCKMDVPTTVGREYYRDIKRQTEELKTEVVELQERKETAREELERAKKDTDRTAERTADRSRQHRWECRFSFREQKVKTLEENTALHREVATMKKPSKPANRDTDHTGRPQPSSAGNATTVLAGKNEMVTNIKRKYQGPCW